MVLLDFFAARLPSWPAICRVKANSVTDRRTGAEMVIYMDDYRTTKEVPAGTLKNATYGDEIMNANWNPAVVYVLNAAAQCTLSPELPEDLTTIDVDDFLSRVYALASQI